MASDFVYEGMRRVSYDGSATFVPVCPTCGRFVKSDDFIRCNDTDGLQPGPNATCSRCGRVEMPFEGFIDYEANNGK
jgi:hypothetical protein